MRLSQRDQTLLGLQELASLLIGLVAGLMIARVLPSVIPAILRYSLCGAIGFIWIADIPLWFVHRGINLDEYRKKT